MNTSIKIFLLFTALTLMFSSCMEEECIQTGIYTIWNPVYKTRAEVKAEIGLDEPRSLNEPGKIYYYGEYLLINERDKGIHVIDNSSPSDPVNLGFITIPGNADMAIKDDLLYADNYMDLISIDISDLNNPREIDRAENVFIDRYYFVEDHGMIVDYEISTETLELDCDNYYYAWGCFMRKDYSIAAESSFQSVSLSNAQNAPQGIGGSLARFTLAQDYLYVLAYNSLLPVDISNGLSLKEHVFVEWGIETLFPYGDKLFIGADDGMHIYDASNPEAPSHLSTFQHARACDPVFVRDQKAYVTLRNGTVCTNFTNQLDVVDITDLTNPILLKSHEMQNPHGLFVAEKEVYVCEGDFGMKVLDRERLDQNIYKQIGNLANINASDIIVIEGQKIAMVIGKEGLNQYDISNPKDPVLLSEILVSR